MRDELRLVEDVVPRFGMDAAAICLLAFGLYYRRHRRGDLAGTIVLFNVAVFLAILVITAGNVGLSVGLGLFAVLSMVHLRSETFSPTELGYFFMALAIALINAIDVSGLGFAAALSGLCLGTVAAIDRRRVQRSGRAMQVTLELVFSDHDALRRHLQERLNMEILDLRVLEVDYVRETTLVSVRAAERPHTEDVHPTTAEELGAGHADPRA